MLPFNPFSALTSKIFGGLLLVSLVTLGPALWITRGQLADARDTVAALRKWQDDAVVAVRLASGNSDVDASTAVAQINEMGVTRVQLGNAIERQNAAIDTMARESAEARRIAAEAEEKRRAAVRRAEALQADLRKRAARPVPSEDMEAAVRRTQDELYEAGL